MLPAQPKDRKTKNRKWIKWALIGSGLLIFFIVYKVFNPSLYHFYPKCIFRSMTGLKCPGCGSQRAIHYLFNLDIINAFKENLLLVISIPYMILGAYFDVVKIKTRKQLILRKRLFGFKAIMVVLVIVISFWILRNIYGF